MRLKIWHENNNFIEISLVEDPAIRRWFDYFKKINDQELNYYSQISDCYIVDLSKKREEPSPILNGQINQSWKEIKIALDQMSKLGYELPFKIPKKFNFNQLTLNRLHRLFTYNAMWLDNKDRSPNPFDRNFKLKNLTWEEWFRIIDTININVHKLDPLTYKNKNRRLVQQKYPLHYLNFFPGNNDFKKFLKFDHRQSLFNYRYLETPNDEYTVILDESILGKSIFRSFYDGDIPKKLDCTGRKGSFGGFFIDLNFNRKQLYRSKEFTDWLKKWNLDPTLVEYEFPIGKVINHTQPLIDFDHNRSKFKQIEFIN